MKTENSTMYSELGICSEVLNFCEKVTDELSDRFQAIDETAEYNQCKVIKAMQDKKVPLRATDRGHLSQSFTSLHILSNCAITF